MNCSECRELLVGYIEELLDAGQKQAVKSHLDICAECRKELEQVTALQERLVANGASHGQNDLENAVMDRIVREQAFQLRKTNQNKQHVNIWRLIMRSSITKLAVAAVIVAAVIAGFHFFAGGGGTKPCLAWDCVISKIMDANTAEFDIIIGEEGKAPVIHEMIMGSKIRWTLSGMESTNIIDLGTSQRLSLDFVNKKAVYTSLKDLPQMPNYMDQLRNFITMLEKTPGFTVEDIGDQVIDGQTLHGFKAKHPKAEIEIWADPKTGLPVRIVKQEGQMKVICENMRFDVPMNESLFDMNAPEGYKIEKQELNLFGSTEEDFIEWLRVQAEVFGNGVFPDDVSIEFYVKTAATMKDKLDKLTMSDDEKTALEIKLQKGLMFIRFFKGEGKWVYAGKGVKLGDAGTAIFWYRPAGSQTYHVIYGDLNVKDIAEADLPRPIDKQ
jgi:hypothetical protein